MTSTTAAAPLMTSSRPAPVTVSTPDAGDAAMAACPCALSLATSFEPISPVPPMTTIFHDEPSFLPARRLERRPWLALGPASRRSCDNVADRFSIWFHTPFVMSRAQSLLGPVLQEPR